MNDKERAALETARYELVTLDGLTAADGAAPDKTFVINTRKSIALIDEVLNESSGANKHP
ncbi:hypothetical protein SAMN05216428_102339 [Nitrosospira sp. Nsp11]|uniref:hypothetical protein n=1 Tax=Nitrosospira sp. Nsp11 TaxID=1855338 RepID=UPI00091BEC08|nr:hypothetical protein [Nitrosospira sp. Nsp11]SHL41780.1 hypothetical protein SAMN05216428_102339 [Nitrosospira sp. Nsp11]